MGKSTISMAIFNSYVYVYQRVYHIKSHETTLNHHKLPWNPIQNDHFLRLLFQKTNHPGPSGLTGPQGGIRGGHLGMGWAFQA